MAAWVQRQPAGQPRAGLICRSVAVARLIALVALIAGDFYGSAQAAATSFNYQGRLTEAGSPATAIYDFRFVVYDASTAGNAVGNAVTLDDVGVTNGLFNVVLDVGPNVFTGADRWLEIAVRPGAQTGAYSVLSPRQPITASPYALYAPNAGLAASVTSVPLSALPASVPRLDTNSQISIAGDLSVVAPTPVLVEGFGGVTFPPAGWTTGGNAAWSRTTGVYTEGPAAAVSGVIGDNQLSYLQFNCTAPVAAVIKFDWKVDSELNFDFLQVLVDGTPMASISGSVDWTPVALALSAGTHTIRWVYSKDVNTASGQDRGWIDNVRLGVGTGTLTTEANVGIGTLNPLRPLQIGDAGVYGSQGLLRMAARSTNSGENRIWDIGVPQTGTDLTGAGYSFIIDDTQLGTEPEFIVHWGNGRVGIGRTNPVSALDVNGTVTASNFVGSGAGLTSVPFTALAAMPLTNGQVNVTLRGLTTVSNLSVTATNHANYLVVTNPPALNGSGISNLNATQLATGTVPLARLPGAVVTNNASGLTLSGAFSGSGAGLAGVNADLLDGLEATAFAASSHLHAATDVASGTLADARLSANVALLSAPQVFTSSNYFTGLAMLTNVANRLAGDGSGLVNLNLNRATGNALTVGRDWGDGPLQVYGSTWVMDQAQQTLGTYFPINGGTVWQSFTAGTNGALAAIQIWIYSGGQYGGGGSWSGTLKIREGEGTAGAVLASQPIAGDGTFQMRTFLLETPVSLTASNQYTYSFENLTASVWTRGSGNVYAGGRGSWSTSYDYWFRTYMINQTAVPALVVQPNTLNVGIGKATPTSALDVNGTVTASNFVGNGAALTNLSAAQLTGTLPIGSLLPAGTMLVSTQPNDPALVTNGLQPMMTMPAPAWVNGATSNALSARSGHTAIWDGQRLILWGGTVGTGFAVNSGSMYYPADDLWDPTSTVEAPSARLNHTAVWTGSEMIVWGGGGAGGFLNTGGRFQPSPQGWRPVTTNAAPAERSGHVATWTGARMLIWGGVNANGLLNDGALYDPGSNQWTALSLPGAPAARRGATAVWAGDRVLVWGGEGSNGVLNSGAQLTLSAGTTPVQWSPINPTNAPAARRWHSAIWTGQKMLIWGGENAGVPLGDGAAFDPVANAWETLFTNSAPTGRFNHVALWTGQEMLILGGSTGSAELSSGAAYDPATAVWRPLSGAGNPQARTEATAAWTGTEILIFGGKAQGQCVACLQRLVPQPVWYFYRKL
jgi:hypothetical protein